MPEAGGVLDQDPYLLSGLKAVISAIDEKQSLDSKKQQAEVDRAKRKKR